MIRSTRFALLACCLSVSLCSSLVSAKGPAYTDPEMTDADFPFQGEYSGNLQVGGETIALAVQVVAMGNGSFQATGYHGGLPGAGWDREMPHRSEGRKDGDTVVFKSELASATIRNGELVVTAPDGTKLGSLPKTERKSPTLGQKPPEGAVVLFDGTGADEWQNGKVVDGLLQQGTTTLRKFGSVQLHIEFRLPYQPEDRGQGRGNSGIYLQGRYEVQMLDSFGLEGKNNECGGLYSVKDCDVNMCLPPLTWQTYDIDYTAAQYAGGKLTSAPRITVRHNGIVIHENVELPGDRGTTAAPVAPGPEKGPIYLQDHGNPVRYRNIWVVEK